METVKRDFYLRDTLTVARELLGKYLVREVNGKYIVGRITETEAYIGTIDKACHAYGGKVTPRTKTLYARGGTSYVYLLYGMYYCMNIVTEAEGVAAAVLLRGVEVVKGFNEASQLRYACAFEELTPRQVKNFSDGPGKLCKAMGITKIENNIDLCGTTFFVSEALEGHNGEPFKIVTSPRIGIDYAEEAVHFPWRFCAVSTSLK